MRYICIDRRRSQYPVTMMCRVLKVSRSGYYAWRVRPECQRAKTDRQLTGAIRRLHEESKGVYGSPKITADLRDEGYRHGRHKVARLMRLAGLRGCPKRRFRVTTQRDPSHPVAENLLDQDFTAVAPNQRWAADITFIATHQGWPLLPKLGHAARCRGQCLLHGDRLRPVSHLSRAGPGACDRRWPSRGRRIRRREFRCPL